MNLEQIIEQFESDREFNKNISYEYTVEEKNAVYESFPEELDARLKTALEQTGIHKLYSHQKKAFDFYREKKNYVITTPTASGKTLAYFLPIVQDKLENKEGKHLFLFPTKALSRDQENLYKNWKNLLQENWNMNVFDGDTAPDERRTVKKASDFVLTNPDMLHSGIMPHHTSWKDFFNNIRTIVIDEMHIYRGVFGSHVANVFRRLNRLLKHYKADPIYIFASATIKNPLELASGLSEKKFELIDESGASSGGKKIIFYNPPLIGSENIRKNSYETAANIGEILIQNNISVIFFVRSRNRAELLSYLIKSKLPGSYQEKIKSYRGGYLPSERREIERQLRENEITAVISTNALELGIDIGMLKAVVSVGYPGSFSSLMQQFGRAGRKNEKALAFLIGKSNALDQYILSHPDFIINSKGEEAVINPDNLIIFMDHLKCAAYETRFHESDVFGEIPVKEHLDYLAENDVLLSKDEYYLWMKDIYPASSVSLRSAAQDNFVIVDKTKAGSETVIGEVDSFSAPTLIHEEAVYLHQNRHYYVNRLDWDKKRAEVTEIKSDYFTDAHSKTNIKILSKDETKNRNNIVLNYGEVTVTTKTILYKKIKLTTGENLGWGKVYTPEITMHTQAAWIEFDDELRHTMPEKGRGGILNRAAYLLKQMSMLVALCDKNDISVLGLCEEPQFKRYALVFYDKYPGGVGLSYKLMSNIKTVLELSLEALKKCSCSEGCPSCVGVWEIPPIDEANYTERIEREQIQEIAFKKESLKLLATLLEQI
ncbi:MAG: DEAD/DEAH box helicase [Spirochaetia bacterium]|nr:DEAD/DEAH box helicase [Spirochaetia bacterium]